MSAEHFWQKRPAAVGLAWGGGELRLFRSGLAASHHHLSVTGFQSCSPTLWSQHLSTPALGLGFGLGYWPSQPPQIEAARMLCRKAGGLKGGSPVAFGEASLAAWATALLAPSSGAIAAWGLWGAPVYLWLCVAPLFLYLGLLPLSPLRPLWAHYPLVPLAHVFATPAPWAPFLLTNRYAFAPKTAEAWATN
jgi:hypothetical protein